MATSAWTTCCLTPGKTALRWRSSDWQNVSRGPGVADVSYFLVQSLTVEDFRDHADDLLAHYHCTLSGHGVSDYPFSELAGSAQLALPVSFAVAASLFVMGDTAPGRTRELAVSMAGGHWPRPVIRGCGKRRETRRPSARRGEPRTGDKQRRQRKGHVMANWHGRGPYAGFQGKIGRTFASSEPWWPPRPAAPRRAPNVVIVLADDLGFSDLGCYGSEIPTPHIDALAAAGLRYVNFHVTPLCSPTRAALMTGRNSHASGFGYVANIDPGFPGYTSELPENQPTVAEVMRADGYATFMVGKWHLCKDSDLSEAAAGTPGRCSAASTSTTGSSRR